MNDQSSGLELFLSSDRAEKEAEKFRAAVESVATAVERMGTLADQGGSAFAKIGKAAAGASEPLRKLGAGGAAISDELGRGGKGADQFERRLRALSTATARSTSAQSAFIAAGRGTAAVLRTLEVTPAARAIGDITTAFANAGAAAGVFSRAAGALQFAGIVGLAATAAGALGLLGDEADATGIRLKQLTADAREAESVARRFDEIRVAILAGEAGAGETLLATLRRDLVELQEEMRRGATDVPAERVLAAIEQRAPATVAALRKVMAEITAFGKEGQEAPAEMRRAFDDLATQIDNRFGVTVKSFGENVDGMFAAFSGVKGRTAVQGFTVDAAQAARAVGQVFDFASGKVDAAKRTIEEYRKALAGLASGPVPTSPPDPARRGRSGGGSNEDRTRLEAVEKLLTAREAELTLVGKTGEQLERARLVQQLFTAAAMEGRLPRIEEVAELAAIEARRKNILALVQEDARAKSVGNVLEQLQSEVEFLSAQGEERERLLRQREAEVLLSRVAGGATAAEIAEVEQLLAKKRELLGLEEKRNQALKDSVPTLKEVSEAQREAQQFGEQFGQSVGDALEKIIIDGEKARDVFRQLAEDMMRQAFRKTVTDSLSNIFGQIAGGLAGGFAGYGNMAAPGPAGGGYSPQLTGGVIPAMGGALIDQYSFLQRGSRTYSVAEGGATTPEAIFRLAKNSRGELGIKAVDGGGATTINMSFPAVRTSEDARAMRATLGQQVRRLMQADGGGRRGLRPRGQ